MENIAARHLDAIQKLVNDEGNFPLNSICKLAELFASTFDSGSRVAFIGNGGSAAEAIHLAAEFTGKCVRDHRPLAAMCLNESQSALTAIGNDYGFEKIFERQVQAHLKKDDILICLSTSGTSPNITKAIEAAVQIGCKVYLWTGARYQQTNSSINVWKVNSLDTPRIQEIHLMWGHILSELVEELIVE